MSKKKEPLSKLCYFITSGAERSLNIEARLFKNRAVFSNKITPILQHAKELY